MFSFFQSIDERVLSYFQSWHNEFLDNFFWYVSEVWIFLPLWLWAVIKIWHQYEKRKILSILILIGITIFLSDQLSNVFKNYFKRLRPTHTELLKDKVRIVNNYRGGLYGFYSAHASNSAAVCLLALLLIRHSKMKYLFIAYPLLSGISRMYLGVHYFSDVWFGWIMGSIIAICTYWIYNKWPHLNK